MINAHRLTTAEAAGRLGVKPATVYAYVSRGLLTRERGRAGSTFDSREVEQLARSSRQATGAGRAARRDGELAFATEVTLIEGGQLWFRGLDAIELSRSRRFEEVAHWLWTGGWPEATVPWAVEPRVADAALAGSALLADDALPIDRFTVAVAVAATADELRHDLGPEAVLLTARGLIRALVESLPVVGKPVRDKDAFLAAQLWSRLSPRRPAPERVAVLNAALVLIADHELAPSTLAARVAAAYGADPYAVVGTGLGPASGVLHAGAPSEVEALLADALEHGADRAFGQRLRQGRQIAGFGMRLYPDGDPRGRELGRRLPELGGKAARRAAVDDVLALAGERGLPGPNVDFGLGALSFLAEMSVGGGQAISVLGRTAGWVAHALEEYGSRTAFRVRATYVGRR